MKNLNKIKTDDNKPNNKVFANYYDTKLSKNNKITTCKYQWWNFIFIFLYEQYQRVFNIFTLIIMICNILPFARVVSIMTLILPIIFVLVVAAIREIVEDVSRKRSDNYQNQQKYQIIRNGQHIKEMQSQHLCQGDILILTENQEVPADSLLLYSSDNSNQCLINTASIDGETALKAKNQFVNHNQQEEQSLQNIIIIYQESLMVAKVFPATSDMQTFNGKGYLKLNLNNQQYLQQCIDKEDKNLNKTIFEEDEIDYNQVLHNQYTKNIKVSQNTLLKIKQRFDINNVLLRGVIIKNTEYAVAAIIYTGNETKLAKSQAKSHIKRSRLESRLNYLQLLLILVLLFLIMIQLLFCRFYVDQTYLKKMIYYQKEEKNVKLFYFAKFLQFLVITSYFLPISLMVGIELTRFLQAFYVEADKWLRRDDIRQYIDQQLANKNYDGIRQHPVYKDLAPCQISVQVRNSSTIENFCEADILFSDKTGTLTKNEMCFNQYINLQNLIIQQDSLNQLSMSDHCELFALALCNTVDVRTVSDKKEYQATSPDEIAFAREADIQGLILQKRTAEQVFYQFKQNNTTSQVVYNVKAVIPFTSERKAMSIVLQEVANSQNQFFTPTSLTGGNGNIFLLIKGADNVMLSVFYDHSAQNIEKQEIQQKINDLSSLGLRTLVFGYKQLNQETITQWLSNWERVKALNANDKQYISVTQELEKTDLKYLFVSAIEDKLQDEIQETLEALRQADIKIWMLTGDKTLTAVSIAKSTKLSGPTNKWIMLTQDELNGQNIRQQLNQLLDNAIETQKKLLDNKQIYNYNKQMQKLETYADKTPSKLPKTNIIPVNNKLLNLPTTIVFDVNFFRACLKHKQHYKLFQLCFSSQSVICCRLYPDEKALIVSYCHQYFPNLTTMAIGDGANDIKMIKSAQIGVGVAGKEGLYACNNSDISLPEFKFLKRLIFVHGRLNHMRNSDLIDYSIYKNSTLVFLNLIYQYYNYFSAQIVVESFLLMMFNTIITFICIFVYTVNEKDCFSEDQMKNIKLLTKFTRRYNPNLYSTIKVLMLGLFNAVVIFYCAKHFIQNGVINGKGQQSHLYFFQSLITMACVFVSMVRVLITSKIYNYFVLFGILLSLLISYLTQFIGNYFTGFGPGQVGVLGMFYSSISPTIYVIIVTALCMFPIILEYQVTGYFCKYVEFTEMQKMQRQQGNKCLREDVTQVVGESK